MWTAALTFISALGSIVLKAISIWQAKQQQDIGKKDAALDGLLKGKSDAETRTQIETEVGKLSKSELDAALGDKWMRD